ncbi:hypothetical protein ES703_84140 [subsurface metagenome]
MSSVKSPIKQKVCRHGAVWRLGFALTLALSLCLMSASLASAQDLAEYFQLSYDPVTFDKNEIQGSEVFHATIAGRATCTKDLPVPLPVSKASLTSQVVAEHVASSYTVTLNASYTVTIESFPSKEGEAAEISQAVPLQFPAQAEPGDYNVIGKIVEAKVKFTLGSMDIASYLPQEQPMGTVKYIAPESEAAPAPVSTPPPSSSPSPPPPLPTPVSAPVPTPSESIVPFWVWLIVGVAGISITINIVWFLRHRTG